MKLSNLFLLLAVEAKKDKSQEIWNDEGMVRDNYFFKDL